jgi:2-polyprenyl-3-methyl-5-hydroxy-6-metoxy-1,4-benzoquinol methylase
VKNHLRAFAVRIRDLARDTRNGLRLKSSFLAAKRRGDILKRIEGLESLFQMAKDATVLDLGCFDGLIAYEFFRSGARLVHGLDNDGFHLDTANRIFSQVNISFRFAHADLRKPEAVGEALGDCGLRKYDIVLFLGVFQHIYRSMNVQRRKDLVDAIVDRVGSVLAMRMPQAVWSDFECLFPGEKFELVSTVPQIGIVGELRVYRCR